MHVLPLLPTALLPFLHQLTATALATGFQNHRSLESRQNISLSLLNAPSNQAPVRWAVDDTHTLVFTAYTPSYPERDYFAALISLQTAIFANYTTSPSPTLEEEVIDYNAYGITIEIDNWYRALYYKLLSQMVGEVGAFLQSWKKCEATWRLVERDEQFGRGARVLCVGAIKKRR